VPVPAAAPAGLPGGAVPQAPQQSGSGQRRAVRRMAELQAQIMRERGVSLSLQAALADITPASGGLDLFNAPAGAIGEELWSGETAYARRYTTLMRNLPLTSYEGTGWQWVTKPKVEAYDRQQGPDRVQYRGRGAQGLGGPAGRRRVGRGPQVQGLRGRGVLGGLLPGPDRQLQGADRRVGH
jgi:hypothetical protein